MQKSFAKNREQAKLDGYQKKKLKFLFQTKTFYLSFFLLFT